MGFDRAKSSVWGETDSEQRSIAYQRGDGSTVVFSDNGLVRERPMTGPKWEARRQYFPKGATPKLNPNEYYPRMWRGGSNDLMAKLGDRAARTQSITAASGVYHMLAEVFRTIEPNRSNRGAFGQVLRSILILACCECEAAWKGILRAHRYPEDGGYWTAWDYMLLGRTLRLAEFELTPRLFEDWGPIRPFGAWASDAALDWYNAYHSVKHDGAGSLSRATLENVITAVAALDIMLDAQFGLDCSSEIAAPKLSQFRILDLPKWSPEEGYYLIDDGVETIGARVTAVGVPLEHADLARRRPPPPRTGRSGR
jgi:hypothetical protein